MLITSLVYDDHYEIPKYAHNIKSIEYDINENGCWECISHAKDKDGYIRLKRGGNFVRLHRYVFELEKRKLNDEEVVMHLCDNPTCFNPDHLDAGTVLANNRDKVNKGRQPRGSACGRAKLSEEDVLAIRSDKRSSRELGRLYGVSKTQILWIKNRKSWAHLA